jgi:sterol 3beta-glucosyltransferase
LLACVLDFCVPNPCDQPSSAARPAALGAGPPPVPYRKLTTAALAAAIRDAVGRAAYRDQARALAARIGREDGTAPVVEALARLQG